MRVPRRLGCSLVCLASVTLSCFGSPLPAPDAAHGLGSGSRAPADAAVEAVATVLASRSTGLLPHETQGLAAVLVEESRRAGFDPELVLALIHVESSAYNFAVSHAGAMGLMQLRPPTAEALALECGIEWRGPASLFDPETNVRLGVRYLEQLVERYGQLPTALAAYNWGPTRIAERLRHGEPVPVIYANRVLDEYRRT